MTHLRLGFFIASILFFSRASFSIDQRGHAVHVDAAGNVTEVPDDGTTTATTNPSGPPTSTNATPTQTPAPKKSPSPQPVTPPIPPPPPKTQACERKDFENGNIIQKNLESGVGAQFKGTAPGVGGACVQETSQLSDWQKMTAICQPEDYKVLGLIKVTHKRKTSYVSYEPGTNPCLQTGSAQLIENTISAVADCLEPYIHAKVSKDFNLKDFLMTMGARETGLNPLSFDYDQMTDSPKMGLLGVGAADLERAATNTTELLKGISRKPACKSIQTTIRGLQETSDLAKGEVAKERGAPLKSLQVKEDPKFVREHGGVFKYSGTLKKQGAVCDLLQDKSESILKNIVIGVDMLQRSAVDLRENLKNLNPEEQQIVLLTARREGRETLKAALDTMGEQPTTADFIKTLDRKIQGIKARERNTEGPDEIGAYIKTIDTVNRVTGNGHCFGNNSYLVPAPHIQIQMKPQSPTRTTSSEE